MATLTTTPIKTFVSGETVTPSKLNELSQSAVALTAGTIVAADLAANAVTTAKILDANVTAAKLADESVIAAKIDDDAVTTAKILDANVTTSKIANANVTAAKLDGVPKDGSGDNVAVGTAPVFGCRAWVNFDGTKDTTGAVSTANTNRLIRASGNVASVLRNSVGNYTIAFTVAMPDANYCVCGITAAFSAANTTRHITVNGTDAGGATNKTASQVNVLVGSTAAASLVGNSEINVAIFR